MSSVMVKALVIVSLFIPAVWPSKDLWTLTCLPTAGIVSQTTLVNCNFKDIKDFKIVGVQLTKVNQDKPIFEIIKGTKSGDQRFSLENPEKGPSLQISDTVFSDEGEYLYRVITNRGEKTVPLYISISAKYKNPITSTWPEDVIEGAPVDLYCNATDGYPAGFIHWFDRSGTNWTMNSHLTEDTKDINGFKYVALSSKLTFKTIDSQGMAPFTCIVLNSKYTKDGESTLTITSAFHSNQESSASNTIHIVAGVMVIGSLIVGLLCALLIFQKRNVQRYEPPEPAEDDLEASNNSLNP